MQIESVSSFKESLIYKIFNLHVQIYSTKINFYKIDQKRW